MKSVLIIIPFAHIYPPMNGGMQRCFHILNQLAKHFDVTAIIHQDKESFLKSVGDYPAIGSVKLFSTKEVVARDVFNILPQKFEKALRYRWYKKTLKGSADSSLLQYYQILKALLTKQKFDIIILENLATLNAISIIRKYDQEVKIIYNAHNVDSNLAKAAFNRGEIQSHQWQGYYKCESNLHKVVDGIFTCSQNDKDEFVKMNNGKLLSEVVPNGVSIPTKKYDAGVNQDLPEYILFCGSLGSIPNAEGLNWFCKKVWPLIILRYPSLKLLVVGSGELPEKYYDINETKFIQFTRAVGDVKPWYNKATVAVVPLLTGSGTRLKILEAMGLGVPVISTTIGAEGITYTNGKDILIANSETDFAEKIFCLLKDKEQRLHIQHNAKKLVEENYAWNRIGNSIAAFIDNK